MTEPSDQRTVGLRERKKAATRAAIQQHALRLFRDQGYDATTVQQIIAEAEVSESTFFRYFPTKADVVLSDDFDPLLVGAFRAQPGELSSIGALRAAFHAVYGRLSVEEMSAQWERVHLVLSVPELRATMFSQLASGISLLADVVAERTGCAPGDIGVLSLAGAVIGAFVAVMFSIADDPNANIGSLLDETMAHLEAGFTL